MRRFCFPDDASQVKAQRGLSADKPRSARCRFLPCADVSIARKADLRGVTGGTPPARLTTKWHLQFGTAVSSLRTLLSDRPGLQDGLLGRWVLNVQNNFRRTQLSARFHVIDHSQFLVRLQELRVIAQRKQNVAPRRHQGLITLYMPAGRAQNALLPHRLHHALGGDAAALSP